MSAGRDGSGGTENASARLSAVPHYYFHVCNGDGFTEDEEGRELPDAEAARAEAVKGARAIMADELQHGTMNLASFIEVEDGARRHLFTVSFTEVVEFTGRHEGGCGEARGAGTVKRRAKAADG